MDIQPVFWILAILITVALSINGIAYHTFTTTTKRLESAIENLRQMQEKLATRVNAQDVSIAKLQSVFDALSEIKVDVKQIKEVIKKAGA